MLIQKSCHELVGKTKVMHCTCHLTGPTRPFISQKLSNDICNWKIIVTI